MREFCQNIEPWPQPQPCRNKQGDCFACAAAAALRFHYPESGITFDEVFSHFEQDTLGGGKTLSNTWTGMIRAMESFNQTIGGRLDVRPYIVQPRMNAERFGHTWFVGGVMKEYFMTLEGFLRSGWAVLTEMDMDAKGPFTAEGLHNTPNHFVLLDGIRQSWKPFQYKSSETGEDKTSRHLEEEVRVVCSARGVYWVTLKDLVYKYGAAGWVLCRPGVALY